MKIKKHQLIIHILGIKNVHLECKVLLKISVKLEHNFHKVELGQTCILLIIYYARHNLVVYPFP